MDIEEELGTYKVYPEVSDRIRKHFGRENQLHSYNPVNPLYDLEKAAWIALIRFPELQQREKIGVKEIKERFSELKETGYCIKPYSKMNREEAWNYLKEIKNDIRDKLKIYSPETLREINRENRERLEKLVI